MQKREDVALVFRRNLHLGDKYSEYPQRINLYFLKMRKRRERKRKEKIVQNA